MCNIVRLICSFLSFFLVSCAAASPGALAPTAMVKDLTVPGAAKDQTIARITDASPTPALLPASKLVAIPETNIEHFSTVIGDLEFSIVQFPDNQLVWATSTPKGLVAAIFQDGSGSASLRLPSEEETWESVPLSVNARVVATAGEDLIVIEHSTVDRLTRYALGGDGYTEIAWSDFNGFVRRIVFGLRGAVAVSNRGILFSSDGIHFSEAMLSPNKNIALAENYSNNDVFAGGCKPDWSASGAVFGVASLVLATSDGFVALAPAHSGDMTKLPICEPVLWSSIDGSTWEQVSDKLPFGTHAFVKDIAERNGWFVAIGGLSLEIGAVWVSDNGLTWDKVNIALHGTPEVLAAGEMGWMLIDKSFSKYMWFSVDGITWEGPYVFPYKQLCGWFPLLLAVGSDAIFGGCVANSTLMLARLQD